MESSSKAAMVIGKKERKRRSKEEEEYDDGFKTKKALEELSSLRPCSSSLNGGGLKRRICFWGETDEYKPEIDWFVVDLDLDLLHSSHTTGPRKADGRRMSAFYHDHCHHTNTDKERKKREMVLSPLFTCKKEDNIPFYGNSCTSLGSILYSIGGCFFDRRDMSSGDDHKKGASKLVHYFDTDKPHEGWKEAPPMITHRYRPQIVTLHHKLYVFGLDEDYLYSKLGPDHDPKSCVWAEVFDPSLGHWTPLPKPPSLLLESDFFIAIVPSNDLDHMKKRNNNGGDYDEKDKQKEKILVLGFDFQTSNRAYEFDVATGSWTFSDSSFKLYHRLGTKMNYPHVLVDDVLYWVGDEIYAHDIGTGIDYAGPVQDLYFHYCLGEDETHIYGSRQPAVLHLGGRYFCLLRFDNDNDNRPTFFMEPCQKRIHCLIIKVSTAKDLYFKEDDIYMFLNASVLSCQSFLIDRETFSIDGLMLL